MKDVYDAIERALNEGEPLVVATVASARGSTPRKPGAKMAVRQDGSICGTIGGGCGEAEVWQAAMDTMRDGQARVVTVDLTEDVEGPDKICGGIMDVFVERLVEVRVSRQSSVLSRQFSVAGGCAVSQVTLKRDPRVKADRRRSSSTLDPDPRAACTAISRIFSSRTANGCRRASPRRTVSGSIASRGRWCWSRTGRCGSRQYRSRARTAMCKSSITRSTCTSRASDSRCRTAARSAWR